MPPISIVPISVVPVSILWGKIFWGEAQRLEFGFSGLHIPVARQRVEWEYIPVEMVLKIENTREAGSRESRL